jgi:RNA polymerase sigma factor (sigma-70 family)
VAIAANEARQHLRRQRRVTVVDLTEATDRQGSGDPAAFIGVVDLERALRKLQPDDRTLLALRFVADLDSNEIALHLGLTASGVRSRLARLLERLRHDLEPDGSRP